MQAPGKFFPIRVLGNKSEKIEVTLRIAHHAGEIVDLKQAQITMIILNALLLEFGALFRRKLIGLAFLLRPGRPLLMIFQERLAFVRTLTVGPPAHFHLQHAKVNAQLQLLASVEAGYLAHLNVAILVRPIF